MKKQYTHYVFIDWRTSGDSPYFQTGKITGPPRCHQPRPGELVYGLVLFDSSRPDKVGWTDSWYPVHGNLRLYTDEEFEEFKGNNIELFL